MRGAQLLRVVLGAVDALSGLLAALVAFTFIAAALNSVGSDRLIYGVLGLAAFVGFIASIWTLRRIREIAIWKLALVPVVSLCLLLPGFVLMIALARHPP
jgi:membrane associated rhomboid family serine protease